MTDISVVICTYNRIGDLKKTLIGIGDQTFNKDLFEVIIVDNACDQKVANLVTLFTSVIPNLFYIEELIPGLSYARNRGVSEANGAWIIFLDDDAVPRTDWLQNLVVCIEETREPSVIGGRVYPSWAFPPPEWLITDLYPSLSISLYEGKSKYFILDFPLQYPVGANIVYHKTLIQKFGGFDPRFGRIGDLLLSGEETLLNYKIWNAGYPIIYCSDACVYHQIPPERLKKNFFRSRYYWGGRTLAMLNYKIFDLNYLINQLMRRILGGLFTFVGYFYEGVWVKKSLFLTELRCREYLGYIIQSWIIVWSSFWFNNNIEKE